MINDAMRTYHNYTCIKFEPHSGQRDYVVIKSDNSGCWATMGRQGGLQYVNLQAPGCVTLVDIILEFFKSMLEIYFCRRLELPFTS